MTPTDRKSNEAPWKKDFTFPTRHTDAHTDGRPINGRTNEEGYIHAAYVDTYVYTYVRTYMTDRQD